MKGEKHRGDHKKTGQAFSEKEETIAASASKSHAEIGKILSKIIARNNKRRQAPTTSQDALHQRPRPKTLWTAQTL